MFCQPFCALAVLHSKSVFYGASVWARRALNSPERQIWGIWQGLTPRDAGALKRLGPLLRFFGRSRHFLQSAGWVPHTAMLQSESVGVYASAWPVEEETLWTVANRAGPSKTFPVNRLAPCGSSVANAQPPVISLPSQDIRRS
jgi:hypothetical protein